MKQLWDKLVTDILPSVWGFLTLLIITFGLVGGTVALIKWVLRLFEVIV